MRIIDLEACTGLDRATIRFYEKQGLIMPARHSNGYREYAQEDQEQLLKIKLLRQLDVSLGKIKELQQGSADFQSVLNEQIAHLESQRDRAQRSAQICRMMQTDSVTYSGLNAAYYLEKYDTIALTYPDPMDQRSQPGFEFQESVQRPFHPFLHYSARGVDYTFFVIFLVFIQVVLFRLRTDVILVPVIFALPLWIPFEAICYTLFGTTPGKWAHGMSIESIDGCKLNLRTALRRAFGAVHYGMGWGFLGYWRMHKSYIFYRDNGYLPWDDESEVVYHIYDRSAGKQVLRATVVIVLMIAMVLGTWFSWQSPRYGNGVSIRDFAICYNDYRDKFYGAGPDLRWNGEFKYPDRSDYAKTHSNFIYQTSNGNVTGLSYWETWDDYSTVQAMPNCCIYAASALLEAIEGKRTDALDQFKKELLAEVKDALSSGKNEMTFTYEIIRIHWRISYDRGKPDGYFLNAMFIEGASARIDVEITLI